MRLGDLDALKDKLKINFSRKSEAQAIYQHLIDIIDDCPTVEQEIYMNGKDFNLYLEGYKQGKKNFERPHGEWNEWTDERWGGTTIYCPYCKEDALEKYSDGLHRQVKSNFCPNCGADMRGAESHLDNTSTVAINKDFYRKDKSNPINRSDLFQ